MIVGSSDSQFKEILNWVICLKLHYQHDFFGCLVRVSGTYTKYSITGTFGAKYELCCGHILPCRFDREMGCVWCPTHTQWIFPGDCPFPRPCTDNLTICWSAQNCSPVFLETKQSSGTTQRLIFICTGTDSIHRSCTQQIFLISFQQFSHASRSWKWFDCKLSVSLRNIFRPHTCLWGLRLGALRLSKDYGSLKDWLFLWPSACPTLKITLSISL